MGKMPFRHNFTSEEDKLIVELMEQEQKRTWQTVSNVLFKRFRTRIPPIQIKEQWGRLAQEIKPDEAHASEFIKMIRKYKFKYNIVARKMQNTKFKSVEFGKEYLKEIYIQTIKYLQKFAEEILKTKVITLQDQERNNMATFLLRGQDRHRGLQQPYALRDYLVRVYEEKQTKLKVKRQVMVQACKIMKKVKEETLCEREHCESNDGWSYKWTEQELLRLFQLYKQFGQNFLAISNIMKAELGQKQTYNWLIVRARLIKLQKTAFINLKKQIMKRGYEEVLDFQFSFNPETARKFVWDKADEQFYQSVKLMSLAFQNSHTDQELLDLYYFVNYYLSRDRGKTPNSLPEKKAHENQMAKQILKNKFRNLISE